jgi:hypothetical protein
MPARLSKATKKTVVAFDRGWRLKSGGPRNLGCGVREEMVR